MSGTSEYELKPVRFGFGEGVRDLGEKYDNIVVLGADITKSVSLNFFAERFPERFFSFGIAEQNIAAVAAGLALGGKIPFFSTYGVFAAFRSADQIRVSVCYNNLPVKIGGAHAGISVGPDGATHQALEDIAVMRTLPNMTLLSPADANQARLATMAAVEQVHGPVYIRFGREPVPNFTPYNHEFIVGKAQVLCEGTDIGIIATGNMVYHALKAAELLSQMNIKARVVNLHTIKPIDIKTIIETAHQTQAIVTVEEHQVAGGMGSAVCEVLSQHCPVAVKMMGINDRFGESGQPNELLAKFQLTPEHIAEKAKELYHQKQK